MVRLFKVLVATSIVGLLLGGLVGTIAADRFGVVDVAWQDDADALEVTALIAQHDCWQGEPPLAHRDRIPGHAVVRPAPNQGVVYSAALVSDALEHVVNGAHRKMTVYAFCP